MPTQYSLNAPFMLEDMSVWAVNIISAPFLQAMPAHKHATGCYEIHFISAGRGTLQTEHDRYAVEPDSERLQFSPRQTQRLLKNYYGSTFRQKKQEARLSAAVAMLQDSRRHIAEISEALDFSSPEHFSNAFKKAYGMSPSRYRKQKS